MQWIIFPQGDDLLLTFLSFFSQDLFCLFCGCSVASTAVEDTNKSWFLRSVRRLGTNTKECRCQHLISATNCQLWHVWGFVPLLLPSTATSLVLSSFPPRLHHPLCVLPPLPNWEKLQLRSLSPNCAHQCHQWTRFCWTNRMQIASRSSPPQPKNQKQENSCLWLIFLNFFYVLFSCLTIQNVQYFFPPVKI